MDDEMKISIIHLGELLRSGMSHAHEADRIIFKMLGSNNPRDLDKQTAAVGYLNLAYSDFRSMWTLSVSNPDLDRQEIQDAMHRMSTFSNEMLTNISTNHSHQWSDIEYGQLVKSAYVLEGLLNVSAISQKDREEYLQ